MPCILNKCMYKKLQYRYRGNGRLCTFKKKNIVAFSFNI